MKTTTKFLYVATVLALFVTLYACKGPAGDVGPAGATGATGATGSTGATGASGASGAIYSEWITPTFSATTFSATLTAPKLTQEIVDRGAVHVYLKGQTLVFPLPYIDTDSLGRVALQLDYAIGVGRIVLFTNARISGIPFRYVLIPGSTPGGRKAAIDFNNYEAVKKEFDLPD
jgi:hypothetical protein